MCILCVIQKWSRRVATMLPWLVIPLIGLWALSQLLPPAFRFEITSPRLACVSVLLVTLFWYEILMPQLSAWRVRRNAQLRERKRCEAIEMQKLRKTATRRCRNCLTPYRDQNPGGGRFMCSYCGHISKRPVLDLPVPPGLGSSNSGIIKDLVGKGGKILNGKTWSDNRWLCGQDWLENGNWVGGPFAGKPCYWRKNGRGLFGGDEHCLAEKSYSGVVIFACKLLTSFIFSIRWLFRKIFRHGTSEDGFSDAGHRDGLAKRGENGTNFNENRSEKARRKAEEKRQARLEKELLEEEERKQREEVARLVEERRRLRDEKMEAENCRKESLSAREKGSKKEAEKKRQERRKEKDKGSSKSNSDVEELEKKAGDAKRDGNKKIDIDRRQLKKSGTEILKGQSVEMGHGMKNISSNNLSRGNAGTRYLDRMRGTFFSSSKAFTGGSFFGKGANTPATLMKENKGNSSVDHTRTSSAHRREFCPPERIAGQLSTSADHNSNCPVLSEQQSKTVPKKSWQQLFTRSTAVPQSSNANVISRPSVKVQAEVQSPPLCGQSSTQLFDNPISFGLPSPFTLPTYPNGSTSSSLGFSPPVESMFPHVGGTSREFIPEEPEIFEDPCYDPDPISLLGPVSESLDIFQLDPGTVFVTDRDRERPRALKNISVFPELKRPSPIESPLSRLRDERQISSNRFQSTLNDQDTQTLGLEDMYANNKGTWQMWNTSPLGHDGLGLVGGSASWILPMERNRSNREDSLHSSSQRNTPSLFTQEHQALPCIHSPQKVFLSSAQNGGTFSPITVSSNHEPRLQSAFFPPLSSSESHFSREPQEETTQGELIYGSPNSSAVNDPFESSPRSCWSKNDLPLHCSSESIGKSPVARPHIGGLFPNPDVQSLWSFD